MKSYYDGGTNRVGNANETKPPAPPDEMDGGNDVSSLMSDILTVSGTRSPATDADPVP